MLSHSFPTRRSSGLAGLIDPFNDIAELDLVVYVDNLDNCEKLKGCSQMNKAMKVQAKYGNLIWAKGYIQGTSVEYAI